MKISIITVCYNSELTIRECVESVLDQDYPNIEYIIVDGSSSDRTMDIVREYGDRIDTVISEPDKGIYDAMNKGIAVATGDVIGMLNSDDFYADTNVLTRLLAKMREHDSDTVYADLEIVDAEDTRKVVRYYDSGKFKPERLGYGWMPAHPTLLVRRDFYKRLAGYSLEYQIAADFEMIVRLFHSGGASYAYLPEAIVKMRMGGISTKGLRNSWLLNREIVRACRSNGIKTSLLRVLMKTPAKLMELVFRSK